MNMRPATFFLLLFAFNASAQIQPLARTELSYDRDFYIDELFNCHEHGLVVSTSNNPKSLERDPDRLFLLYDTNLIETSSLKIEVPFRQKINSTYTSRHVVYTFYYDGRFGDYTVVGIDPQLEKEIRFEGKLPRKIEENGFVVYSDLAVVVNNSKRIHELVVFQLEGNQHHSIALEQQLSRSSVDIIDLRVFDNQQELGILYREHTRTKAKTWLIVLNHEGNISQRFEVGNDKQRVIRATPNRLANGNLVVSGTYTHYIGHTALGMFLSSYDHNGEIYFSERPFGSFNNFFDYMSKRGVDQMNRKKQRFEASGRTMDVNVLMLVHPAQALGSELVVMGEVYYPTYQSVSNTTYMNGRPTVITSRVFDGYQYSHAAMARFTPDGKFINDLCFPISLWKKPFHLDRIVQMQIQDTTIKLAYMNFNTLKSQTITPNKTRNHTLNLQAGENDQIRNTSADIVHWFGNYFVSSGYQNLKSDSGELIRRKREVFYIQKVEIE